MPKLKVDRTLLLRVAKNAHLELTEAEIKTFLPQFEEILSAFEKIGKVNISGVAPAFQPIPLSNRFRGDEVKPGLSNAEALQNAVHKDPPYFKGPKAME